MEKKTVLPNGIRILTEEIPYVYSAVIGMWIDTGSKNEEEDIYGISHFIEHMLFKGTKNRTALEIVRELEETGGSINAFTDKENTCIFARVLNTHIDKAIDVLTDVFLNSTFDEVEIEKEKGVVIEELKMYEDSPDELSYDTLIENVWKNHPLGHKIVGTIESVQGITRDKILSYMENNYTYDRIVISVAGNIDSDDVISKLESRLGKLKTKNSIDNEPSIIYTTEVSTKFKDIEQTHVCLGVRGTSLLEEDRYIYSIIDSILGGGMSSRLFQEVREKRSLVYSIGSYELLYRKGGIFGVYACCSPNNLKDVVKYTLEEFNYIKDGRLDEELLYRAKELLKGSLLLSLETVKNRMIKHARNEVYFQRSIPPEEIIEKIDAVTLEQVTNLAKEIFVLDKTSLVVVGAMKELPFSLDSLN